MSEGGNCRDDGHIKYAQARCYVVNVVGDNRAIFTSVIIGWSRVAIKDPTCLVNFKTAVMLSWLTGHVSLVTWPGDILRESTILIEIFFSPKWLSLVKYRPQLVHKAQPLLKFRVNTVILDTNETYIAFSLPGNSPTCSHGYSLIPTAKVWQTCEGNVDKC